MARPPRDLHEDAWQAALRRARDEVDTIDRMAAGARLQTYRAFLQATVRFASPVLLRAIGAEGIPFSDVADGLRPPPGWPRRGHSPHAFRQSAAWSIVGLPEPWSSDLTAAAHSEGGPRAGGLRIDTRGHGVIGVRVVESSVEVQMLLGPCRLRTARGLARLRTDRLEPGTLAPFCIGRRLDGMIDHPLLRGSGWTIDRIDSPPGVAWSVVVFATGQEPTTMPWSRGGASRGGR